MNLVMNSFASSIRYAVRSQRRNATEYAAEKHGTVYVHVSYVDLVSVYYTFYCSMQGRRGVARLGCFFSQSKCKA